MFRSRLFDWKYDECFSPKPNLNTNILLKPGVKIFLEILDAYGGMAITQECLSLSTEGVCIDGILLFV